MDLKKRLQNFSREIDLIKSKEVKAFVIAGLSRVPEYFFTAAASSTGKYHTEASNLEGGLLRHTKLAVRYAEVWFENPLLTSGFSDLEKDIVYASLIFHDSFKYGIEKDQFTKFEHPIIAAEHFRNEPFYLKYISKETLDCIANAIERHNGPWITSSHYDGTLKMPETKIEAFVHMCDYLASK